MNCDAATKIVRYFGCDPDVWNVLRRSFPEPEYQVHQSLPVSESWWDIPPSWRCECVLVLDDLEDEDVLRHWERWSGRDAGVPVVALVNGSHCNRLTAAGVARRYGVQRIVVKPWNSPTALEAAVRSAFAWLDHWRAYLTQTLFLTCEGMGGHPLGDASCVPPPGTQHAAAAATACF